MSPGSQQQEGSEVGCCEVLSPTAWNTSNLIISARRKEQKSYYYPLLWCLRDLDSRFISRQMHSRETIIGNNNSDNNSQSTQWDVITFIHIFFTTTTIPLLTLCSALFPLFILSQEDVEFMLFRISGWGCSLYRPTFCWALLSTHDKYRNVESSETRYRLHTMMSPDYWKSEIVYTIDIKSVKWAFSCFELDFFFSLSFHTLYIYETFNNYLEGFLTWWKFSLIQDCASLEHKSS